MIDRYSPSTQQLPITQCLHGRMFQNLGQPFSAPRCWHDSVAWPGILEVLPKMTVYQACFLCRFTDQPWKEPKKTNHWRLFPSFHILGKIQWLDICGECRFQTERWNLSLSRPLFFQFADPSLFTRCPLLNLRKMECFLGVWHVTRKHFLDWKLGCAM